MSLLRLIAPSVICAGIAAPVSADITLRMTSVDKDNNGRVSTVTEYRKGLKTRTDSATPGLASLSTIVNIETGVVLMLWHDGKGAEVFNLKTMGLTKEAVAETTQSITPTTRLRQIAGSTCTVYEFKSSTAMSERMPEMTEPAVLVMEGWICLARSGPGHADYVRISRAMMEGAKAAYPQTAVQRQVADLGVPYASEMTISIGANVPGAPVHRIAAHTMEVTSVSTEPIPDSLFEIPAGYTVKRR